MQDDAPGAESGLCRRGSSHSPGLSCDPDLEEEGPAPTADAGPEAGLSLTVTSPGLAEDPRAPARRGAAFQPHQSPRVGLRKGTGHAAP